MASALQLSAANVIINGQGLGPNGEYLNNILAFQQKTVIATINNLFDNIRSANVLLKTNVYPVVDTLGVGVDRARWLIDLWPSNIAAVCSTTPVLLGNTTPTASFSQTLSRQANLPFDSGYTGFANVFFTTYGYANSVFDTISSVNLLQGKTYGELGPGYTGPLDLSTAGIGSTAEIISAAVRNWGTMYDINNIATLGDPYVFGQNLLNQGLGQYGDWDDKLTQAGLDITNLPIIPQNETVTTQVSGALPQNTFVGEIDLPFIANVTTTTVVTGNSPDVVINIYKSVRGANLSSIVSSTGITVNANSNPGIVSLADYLDFSKAVDTQSLNALRNRGVSNFTELGQFIQNKIGAGIYTSWSELADFLLSVDKPNYASPVTTQTRANTVAVPQTVVDTIRSQTGTGSGCFGQPVMRDYLGSCMGWPHRNYFKILDETYNFILTTTVTTAVNNLDRAVTDYLNEGTIWLSNVANTAPDVSGVSANVTAVNAALNSVPTNNIYYTQANDAHIQLALLVQREVTELQRVGVVFNSGFNNLLQFGMGIGGFADDDSRVESRQFFANIINRDQFGDNLISAIAEVRNTRQLGRAGIQLKNDADPQGLLTQAEVSGTPLTTLITRNK